MTIQRASGSLFGMALGDALGAATEFKSVAQIKQKWPPHGPQQIEGRPARVTDDTQMALAVADALHAAPRPYTRAGLLAPLRDAFIT